MPVNAITYQLSYDAAGNLIQDGERYYEYNSLNQLVRVREKTSTGKILEEYSYDANGDRVKKVSYNGNAKTTTYYVSPEFVREVNGTGTFDTIYYYANGVLVARKDSNGKKLFYHPNYLGSTDIVTDEAGNLVEETAYLPFGMVLAGGNDRYLFTGKELDKNTGLMYYGARYYSPFLRHFTQADTVLADVYDPQQLNRYAYARNNPQKYVDPSGNFIQFLAPILAAPIVTFFVTEIFPPLWTNLQAYWVAKDFENYNNDPSAKNFAFVALNFVDFLPGSKVLRSGTKVFDITRDVKKGANVLRTVKDEAGEIFNIAEHGRKHIPPKGLSEGEIAARTAIPEYGKRRHSLFSNEVDYAQVAVNTVKYGMEVPRAKGGTRAFILQFESKVGYAYGKPTPYALGLRHPDGTIHASPFSSGEYDSYYKSYMKAKK